jgi:lipid-A-disaccharide synthase
MRYYIIAGERSGDLHGSNLVNAIKKLDPTGTFRGLGGNYLENAGVELFAHYADFAVMGFAEILSNIVKITGYLRKCRKDLLRFQPDVLILVDYAGFNRQMARFGKKKNIPVFYYISPKVWAWNQRRAFQLKANVDRMFVILPFEKDFYKKFHWDVDYVGNPVLDAVKGHQPDKNFVSKNNFNLSAPIVALLPGSRRQELLRIAPVLHEVVAKFPEWQFAVASVNNLDPELYESLSRRRNVRLVEEDTYNILGNAHAAIVTSGTATLETALFKVPQVVVYKTTPLSFVLAKMVVQVKFISLVNLIAGKEVIKELIQGEATANHIAKELEAIISPGPRRDNILRDYDAIFEKLDTGSASENAARLMVKYLKS